jgi:hypothetical protein
MRSRHLRRDYGALSELIAVGSSGASGNPSSVIPNPTWSQANWYVDPVAGNDGNSGLSPATAVKAITGGIIYKWGTREPILQQNTTIFLLKSETLNQEAAALAPIMVFGSVFGIVGTPLFVTTMVLGTVTAKNRSTPQLLTSTGFGGPGLAVGQLVINTSRGNSRAFIQAISGGTATFCQPMAQLSIADAAAFPAPCPQENDSWTTGDTVNVYTVPALNIKELNPRGGDSLNGTNGGSWWMQYIQVLYTSGVVGNSTFVGMAYIPVSVGESSGVFNGGTLKLDDINAPTPGYFAYLWGPGAWDVSDNSVFEKVISSTWAQVFLVKGATTLDGSATAASYAPGTPGIFTDGRAINAANLDTYGGLQIVQTGGKYIDTA